MITFDGVDVTSFFDEESIDVQIHPVTTKQITTLAGVDHDKIVRWKSVWSAKVLPLTRQQSILLSSYVRKSSISVAYVNPHLGQVTQTMRVTSNFAYGTALNYGSYEYWDGKTLTLEER